MRQLSAVSGVCLWICIPFTVSIKHWINVHDMLFTSLSVVKLILISWFIWEAEIKCKELWTSHRHKATGSHVRVCVCFLGIINRLTCFTLQICSALALSGFACQHSQEEEKKKSHICKTFPKSMVDVLWTVSLKHPRLRPVIKMPSYPGVRRHLLDSQRLCEGKEDLEVSRKDKKNVHENLFT